MAQGRCERPDGKPGPIVRGPVRVVDGEVIIEVGTAGEPAAASTSAESPTRTARSC